MYSQYAEIFAENYEEAHKEYDLKYRDTKKVEARELFDEYLKVFSIAKIPEITAENFKKVHHREMFNYTFYHLSRLLPKHFTSPVIKDLFEKTMLAEGESPLDGLNLFITDTRDGKKMSFIQIPHLDRTSAIPCSSHEYTHNILEKNRVKTIKNAHHTEILSILMELIMSDQSDLDNIEKQMFDKLSILRLDSIIHHSKNYMQAEELSNLPEVGKQLLCNFNPNELKKLKTMINYELHNSYTFLVSYPYALNLFEIYKNDNIGLLSNLDKVFNGEISIQDLLVIYNMSFSKPEIVEKPIKELKRINNLKSIS